MSDGHEEKKWLIKNNNQIIGPFTESEVKDELAKGYISPFATVCVPGQIFWGFIAAYSEFARHTDTTKLTQFTTSLKTDLTKTYTFGTQRILSDQQNKKTNSVSDSSYDVQEVPYKEIGKTPELILMEQKKKKVNTILTICSTAVFIICALFIFFNRKSDLSKSKAGLVSSSHFGRVYFDTGDYSKAMQIWEKERKRNRLNVDDELLFQTLKFQLNDNITSGEAIIHFYEDQDIHSEMKKIIRALIQLKTDDLQSAKQSLTELMNNSQSKDIKKAAFTNLALLSTKTQDCRFFEKYAKNHFGNKNLIYFAFSLCLLQSKSVSVDQRTKAENFLQEIIKRPQGYYQEALVGFAYIRRQKGEEVLSLIEKLLDNDPYLTSRYHYNVYVDRKIYSWPQLLPLCEQIYSSKKNDKLMITFYAYCLVRSYRYELAQEFIKKATLIDSRNVLIKTVYAYITDFANLAGQSVLILGDAIQSNSDMKYILPYILQAQFCEKNKDWECAAQNWHLVLKDTPDSFSGLGGLAYTKYRQGRYAEARAYMDRGFALGNTKLYSPLLFVEKMLRNVDYERLKGDESVKK